MTVATNYYEADDYAWLISPNARPHLARLTVELERGHRTPSPSMVQKLRSCLSASRSSLIFQQISLRARATRKFRRADEMFFTGVLLEQSTSEAISGYKASLFREGPIADLCCGVGGDALGLVKRNLAVTVVDRDPVAGMLAQANCAIYGASEMSVTIGDVGNFPVHEFAAWHMDPDRRPDGRRTTRVESHDPGVEVIESLWQKNPHSLMKLAPAAELPDSWLTHCEREWIGEHRECKQQLIRHGDLVRNTGKHRVTILDAAGGVVGAIVGEPDQHVDFVPMPGSFLYEPHAAVRAAGLVAELALRHGLWRIGLETPYVTGEAIDADATLSAFRVLETMAFDRKRVKQRIRDLGLGHLEIKTRGVGIVPAVEQKKLSTGDEGRPGCLFLFSVEGKVRAVLTERV